MWSLEEVRPSSSETAAGAPEDEDADDDEIHPQYDVTAHLDGLYSVPAYRHPPHASMERWRELGERLLAFGEADLSAAYDVAAERLAQCLERKRRRRRRRRVARPPRASTGAAA